MRLTTAALGTIFTGLLAVTSAFPINANYGYHDSTTAASVARTLVNRESLTNLNTISQDGSDVPVSFVEYYADCDEDGQPTMVIIDISSSNKNIEAGSKASLSIRVGDHQINDDSVSIKYPGTFYGSTAGAPRVNLRGEFKPFNATLETAKCFALRHKESPAWFPGSPVHSSHWVKFEVESVYFIGGFGDRAFIGEIPVEEYLNATILEDEEFNSLFTGYEEERSNDSILSNIVSFFFGSENKNEKKYWKHFGKDQKKHWKNVGKHYKEKYGDDDEESEEVAALAAGEDDDYWKHFGKDQKKYWKHYGKEQGKHWKKVGKHYKEKYGDDDEETEEVAILGADEEDDYWKRFGKDQKKHWKNVGKHYKEKYGDDDEESEEIAALEVSDSEDKDEKKYWKHFGKEQRKHWKNVGKHYKEKYGDDDEESEEIAALEVSDSEDKDEKKYWKHFGKEQRKHWKNVGKHYKEKYGDDDEESEEVAALAAGEDDDYWKHFGKDQKKHWKNVGKDWKKVGKHYKEKYGDDDETKEGEQVVLSA